MIATNYCTITLWYNHQQTLIYKSPDKINSISPQEETPNFQTPTWSLSYCTTTIIYLYHSRWILTYKSPLATLMYNHSTNPSVSYNHGHIEPRSYIHPINSNKQSPYQPNYHPFYLTNNYPADILNVFLEQTVCYSHLQTLDKPSLENLCYWIPSSIPTEKQNNRKINKQ